MSRSLNSILALASITALFLAACGGDDDSSNTGDAAVQDVGSQTETGTGVGRGRGGGSLEEGDGGLTNDSGTSIDTGTDATVKVDANVKLDAMLPPDPTCNATKCDTIRTRYQSAVTSAQSCRTTAVDQCQQNVSSDIACGGCTVWVNSAANVKAIAKEWADAGCDTCRYLCPQVFCRLLGTGVCQKNAATTAASSTVAAPVIIGPPIVIDPIIGVPFNDGTCVNKSISIQPL